MAQVIQRVWRSGPRKVKRTAWGFTYQDASGHQVRKFDATWSKEDAEKALAARLLKPGLRTEVYSQANKVASVTFQAMTERYLKEKAVSKARTVYDLGKTLQRLLAYFGADTPLAAITAPRIAEFRITRLTTKSVRTGRALKRGSVNRELS